MDIFDDLGVTRYINAHDTYTVYGASRMTEQTLEAMCLASKSFVDMEELQRKLGRAAAELTHNEAAYFTNGAAGALTTAAAVCMAKGSAYRFAPPAGDRAGNGAGDHTASLPAQRIR